VTPTAVDGNDSDVGAIANVSVVPDSEIVPELCPFTVKFVVAEWAPAVSGVNEYVTWHDAPAAKVTPLQFCTPPKFESPGAPPANVTTCGVDVRLVTSTATALDVPPTAVDGKAIVVLLKPNRGSACAVLAGTATKTALNAATSAQRLRAGTSIGPTSHPGTSSRFQSIAV
jgi:hypothetical protein